MAEPFVEDWDFVQILGEGAYGEVKLAVNRVSQQAVAVKIVNLTKHSKAEIEIKKEICVHRLLSHDNIITFYGYRRVEDKQYLFLQYASGGELFDRIVPDHGMPTYEAHKYFKQLITGVEYLHSKGVTHRDLKPENLLLDDNDDLKISDFGFSTLFRNKEGDERMLETVCGTIPYLAPEIINRKPYNGEAIDIWSCGIILVAILAGELPWDEPSYECQAYQDWKDCKITLSPWKKIDNLALSLLRVILVENAVKRANMATIKRHPWYKKNFKGIRRSLSGSASEGTPLKRIASDFDLSPQSSAREGNFISASQPESGNHLKDLNTNTSIGQDTINPGISFSQPIHIDHMLLSQFQATQGCSQNPMQRFVRRMTRFFVKTNLENTEFHLINSLEKLGYTVKASSSGQLTISTFDRRRTALTFKACIIEMGENVLVDFRLSKGDGIEFKRQFLRIRDHVKSLIIKVPASQWASQLSSTPDNK